jgi:hypothetical protein
MMPHSFNFINLFFNKGCSIAHNNYIHLLYVVFEESRFVSSWRSHWRFHVEKHRKNDVVKKLCNLEVKGMVLNVFSWSIKYYGIYTIYLHHFCFIVRLGPFNFFTPSPKFCRLCHEEIVWDAKKTTDKSSHLWLLAYGFKPNHVFWTKLSYSK